MKGVKKSQVRPLGEKNQFVCLFVGSRQGQEGHLPKLPLSVLTSHWDKLLLGRKLDLTSQNLPLMAMR